MPHWWDAPFFQVALPIVLAQLLGYAWQNRRFDDLNRRFDDFNRRLDELREDMNRRFEEVNHRLDRIEDLVRDHDRDIAALKERTNA